MASSVAIKMPVCTKNDVAVLEKIGYGSFADVHRCLVKGKERAVKIAKLDSDKFDAKWAKKKLQQEIRVMWQVRAFDFFVHVLAEYKVNKVLTGYVMEFCRCGNLRIFLARLKRGYIPSFPFLSFYMLHQVCCGMQQLQRLKIVHKDVAIDNVLITEKLEAKLSDFGLVKTVSDNVHLATVQFESRIAVERRPPELLTDPLRRPDLLVDRFLFGICIYETLAAEPLRNQIGVGVEDYKVRVQSGHLAQDLRSRAEFDCFARCREQQLQQPAFERVKQTLLDIMCACLSVKPFERPDFDSLEARMSSIDGLADGVESELRLARWPPAAADSRVASSWREFGLQRLREWTQACRSRETPQVGEARPGEFAERRDSTESLKVEQDEEEEAVDCDSSVSASVTVASVDEGVGSDAASSSFAAGSAAAVAGASANGVRLETARGVIDIADVQGKVVRVPPVLGRDGRRSPATSSSPPPDVEFPACECSFEILRRLAKCSAVYTNWQRLLLQLNAPQKLTDRVARDAVSPREQAELALQRLMPIRANQLAAGLNAIECQRGLRLLARLLQL